MNISIYVCIFVHVYTYIYSYLYRYMYTYIHIHVCIFKCDPYIIHYFVYSHITPTDTYTNIGGQKPLLITKGQHQKDRFDFSHSKSKLIDFSAYLCHFGVTCVSSGVLALPLVFYHLKFVLFD